MRGVDAAGQGRQKWIPTRLAHAWSLDLVLLHRMALQKPTARSPWVGFASIREINPGWKSVGDTWEVWAKASVLLGTSFFGEKRYGCEGEKLVGCRPSSH